MAENEIAGSGKCAATGKGATAEAESAGFVGEEVGGIEDLYHIG